ncbi:MAG: GNAT family N-acetyltransferase [Gillisia sp.]|nr:GNAT family N-acetyltransferase [Gillisia sp.]
MNIITKNKANDIDPNWDRLRNSVYQKRDFLIHAENFNPCEQRYYLGYNEDALVAGAVAYKLKVNILTFAKFNFTLPMMVIGIPVSVDAKGLIGNDFFSKEMVSEILKKESGLIICLNYDHSLNIKNIIEMQTLPTLVHSSFKSPWEEYLQLLRHNYRRRILNAEKKFKTISAEKHLCTEFTDEHYRLYLKIMQRTKTKLEILSKDFFSNLPSNFTLYSFYAESELIAWHITVFDKGIYYFLFGGLNYALRNKYDAYYNNLIQIIKEGADLNSDSINLGQTAEISKNRLGASFVEKKMFLFHKNSILRFLFRLGKNVLGYKLKTEVVNVYKNNMAVKRDVLIKNYAR